MWQRDPEDHILRWEEKRESIVSDSVRRGWDTAFKITSSIVVPVLLFFAGTSLNWARTIETTLSHHERLDAEQGIQIQNNTGLLQKMPDQLEAIKGQIEKQAEAARQQYKELQAAISQTQYQVGQVRQKLDMP
jgi:hypothetical protein